MRIGQGILAAVALGMIGAPVGAAVAVTGADVYAGATAVLFTNNVFDVDQGSGQAALQPAQGAIDASATAVRQDAQGNRAFAHEDVFANFTSPTSGTVTFSGNSTSLSLTPATIAEAFNSGSSFNYDFTITSDYVFKLNYALSETDDFYIGNYFQLIRTLGGPPLYSSSPANGTYAMPGTGFVGISLTPGSYEFGVVTALGDLTALQGPDFAAGSHAEQYTFSLTAVPETPTWIATILGLGMVGAGLRRRGRDGAAIRPA